MHRKLPRRKLIISNGVSNKRRRVGKPWWSDDLSALWNAVCKSEGLWLQCKNPHDRTALKLEYIRCRKNFDHAVQRAKRTYWAQLQNDLVSSLSSDPQTFWRGIGKVGVAQSKNKTIPMEVICDDGSITSDTNAVLDKWKHDFSALYNCSTGSISTDYSMPNDSPATTPMDPSMNENISILEVKNAVAHAKKGKACGTDEIPYEVLNNNISIAFIHALLNVCFNSGTVPSEWGRGIINPIPKSSTADMRDPLSYRGITLANTMYKLYSFIINDRLSKWVESNDKIVDEQNGFRKKRSTIDHLSSLTGLIDTRKKLKQSTFCAFIDFKKAYDSIDRDILWKKLEHIGLSGYILNAVKSLYSSVSSCVRINGSCTDWFNVTTGLRQGCNLSPILFNMFINDLALKIKATGKGVKIGDDVIAILLYADDIVLVANDAQELQDMLNILNDWCLLNSVYVNSSKSNIVHFRPQSIDRTSFKFMCGRQILTVIDKYKYLGVMLNEFVDFSLTAKMVAQSASRALGLLIAKCKSIGGMPYDVFTKLYDSMVWPVISYGAAVWGDRSYACINAVQNRAMRFFLGTGKYTPNAAVSGDMGWQQPLSRQWKSVCLQWHRLTTMNNTRVNSKIFNWCLQKSSASCKNWCYSVKHMFSALDLSTIFNNGHAYSTRFVIDEVISSLTIRHMYDWQMSIDKEAGSRGNGGNKLRVYRLFKRFYGVEHYCKENIPLSHRAAFAKFRCGVAPLKIETGRYMNLPVDLRVCPFCVNVTEDETHAILHCPAYEELRRDLFDKVRCHCNRFTQLDDIDKICVLFSTKSLVRVVAKTCFNILRTRNLILYK